MPGLLLWIPANAAITANLTSDKPSPQPLATLVRFEAAAAGGEEIRYRFRARSEGGNYRMIRDFSPVATLEWTAAEWEGAYEVELTARASTGETAAVVVPFRFTARAASTPVVSPTSNTLVHLYSAPPCPAGSEMQVQFWGPDGRAYGTPRKKCRQGLTMNFYLAGLRATTAYTAQHVIWTDSNFQYGPEINFLSGPGPGNFPTSEVTLTPLADTAESIILHAPPLDYQQPWATDLTGQPVWYYPGTITVMTRMVSGGSFWGLVITTGPKEIQIIREFDLAGVTLRETNAARINEQLRELGKREIAGFHHEITTLPDGKILVLAGIEQILTDVQGPGDVNVLGDMIMVLDENLQVVWTWDAFDHLDATRTAVLKEWCGLGGCPSLYLGVDAADWVHGNSVTLTPDGHFLYSSRHQDWVLKIHYDNGAGHGGVIWRFGKEGDFLLDSSSPDTDWFSHQHDARILPDGKTLILFDNANTLHLADPDNTRSRGQVYEIDEERRSARLIVNADLGTFSFALGNAQKLRNGSFHFNVGWIVPGNTSIAFEVDASGNQRYGLTSTVPAYRSFRLVDLYTAPD